MVCIVCTAPLLDATAVCALCGANQHLDPCAPDARPAYSETVVAGEWQLLPPFVPPRLPERRQLAMADSQRV